MNKKLLLLVLPLLLVAVFVAIPQIPSVHANPGTGQVCIQDFTSVPQTNPAPCTHLGLNVPPTFDGPFVTPAGNNHQIQIGLYVNASDALNGWDITLLANHNFLIPSSVDPTHSLVGPENIPGASLSVVVLCMQGVSKVGNCLSTDSIDTLHYSVVGSKTTGVSSGLLFTAVYNITGQTPAGGISIGYQSGCAGAQSIPGSCIAILTGTPQPAAETSLAATFDNSGTPAPGVITSTGVPYVTVTSNVPNLNLLAGKSGSVSLTVTAQNGWPATLGLPGGSNDVIGFTDISSTGLVVSLAPGTNCSTGGTVCVPVTVGMSAAVAGNYFVTFFANYVANSYTTGQNNTLSAPVTVSVKVTDYSWTVTPTTINIPRGPTFSNLAVGTLTSINGFAGTVTFSAAVAPAGLTTTFSPTSFALPAGGTTTVNISFSSTAENKFTDVLRACSAGATCPATGLVRSVTATVFVNGFNITDTSSHAVAFTTAAGSGTDSIKVQSLPAGSATAGYGAAGSSGVVTFTTSVSPVTGLTATCTSLTVPPGGTVTGASNCTFTSATIGTYIVTINGLGGTNNLITNSTTVTVTVSSGGPPPGINIAAGPTSVTTVAGAPGTSTITLTARGGFTGTGSYSFTATGGLTCTFNPTTFTLGATATTTLSCSSPTVQTDTATVTATSGTTTNSTTVTFVIQKASTTTTLASSVNPSVFGQSVTFTATVAVVAPGAGNPTGTVNFLDGATVIGSCTLPASAPFTCTFSTAALSVATHSITATYLGDVNFLTSTSGAVSQVVNKANTSTNLTSSVNPSVFGQSVTFTATVTVSAPGAGSPTGTVNFLDGATNIGSCTLPAVAPFTCTFSTAALSVGTHSITASYAGNANFNTSTSTAVSQVVNKASTSTTLASSLNPSVFGQSVTFTATVTVTAPGAGTPTGTVNFLDGATTIGSCALPAAAPFTCTFSTAALGAGTHSITATYVGDGNFNTSTSGAVSQVVNKANTSTTLASSANPSVFGQSVTFTATVTVTAPGAGSPTGTVNFLDGATVIGSCALPAASPFTCTFSTSALSVSTHSITATYLGDTNFNTSTSTAISQVVNKANTTTTLASSVNPSVFGQSVTFTATVAAVAPGAGSPSGSVTFLDGATTLGTGTLSGGVATFSTSALAVGSHSITASYGGDANFNGSTSAALTQTVNKANTTTTLASSVNPSVFGQSVTFTATVAVVAPGAGSPAGTVNFLDGATVIGSCSLPASAPFTCTFSTAALSVATHSITATYVGNANFNTSTSTIVSQVVNKANTTTSLSSSVNPSVFGQSVTFTATVAVVAPGAGTPTGTVNFLDGATNIGSCTLPAAAPFTCTFSTVGLSVATHSITSTYVGDGNFNTSTSAAVSQVVNKASTATALTSGTNPSVFGQSVTFTATVTVTSPGAGTPTGTVNFLDGATNIGSCALPAAAPFSCTFSTAALSVATHSMTATYVGDGNFNTSTSAAVSQVVNKANTTTSLTSGTNPSVFGQSVTFTATVAVVAPGAGTPAGTVNFLDGATNIGSCTLPAVAPFTCTFSTAALSVGIHSITASYAGNANFNTSTSTAVSQVVNKANTTTTLASSVNPSVFGQSVTFTATVAAVAPGAGSPSGTVTFLDGATTLGTGTLSGGVATFSTSALAVGSHSITASYGGDANFNTSTSAVLTQTVNKANTTTTVASSANPSVFGQSVTFTATVAPVAPGAGTPSGTVTFLDGATTLGTGTLSAGTASFTTSTLAVGSHSITASYGGDANFNGSTSAALTQTVNKANTTTTVASSVNPSVFGQSVTFTATVAAVAPGAGTPSGTVTFLDGATTLGTGTLSGGTATFSTSALAVGSHSITASYGGDANFNTSTSAVLTQTVNKANTTTTVASSVNPSVFGQSVTFTATVAVVAPGAGSPAGTVNFLDGATNIGSCTLPAVAPFSCTFSTSSLAVGAHSITASYGGNANFNGSTSAVLTQTVNKANTTTTVASSVNPSVFGQSVTFTATVAPVAPGAGTPTGTVTFLDGATTLGTGTLSGGSASFTTSALAVGSHSITASYGGDANFNGSTSAVLTQTANKANTTTTVASSLNPSTFGQSVTFTATVAAVAPGAGTPSGTVTFLDGATTLGTGTLSGGTASFTTSTLAVGSHSITASYGGDANFNGSTSAALTQTVNPVSGVTISTTVQNAANVAVTSVVLGTAVHDTAALSGQTATAGGLVTYSFWNTGTCSGTKTAAGTVTVTNGVVPNSNTITPTAAGSFSFNATYSGDVNNNRATSPCEPLTVTQASTTTTVASSANPSVFGQSVTFTATVTGSTTVATPTGTVTFLDGVTTLGTGTLSGGTATFTTSALAVGSHSITASYGGDTNFTGSTSAVLTQTVNKANTTTTLASSLNPSTFGQSVTFTATVTVVSPGAGSPSGTVTFLDGAATLGTGTLSGGTATFTTSTLAAGSHSITASYGGDTSFNGSTSAVLTQTVNKANTTTTIASSVNPSVFGQSVTFTATVAVVAPGAGSPAGTVNFLDGATVIGTGTLSASAPFTATFTTSSLAVGAHSITASYAGNANFNGSTSAVLTQTVNKANTSTTVASSLNPSTFGQSVTFTATVAVVSPGAGSPSGTVTFLDGATTLGTGTLSGGTASFTTSTLAVGSHSITASYGGDTNFNGSTSAVLTQTVNPVSGVTISTTIQNSANVAVTSVVLGTAVHDTATLSGQTATAGGTVSYSFWNTGTCGGTKTAAGTVTVTNGIVPNSNTITPIAVGSYSFNATYSGDTNNNRATSPCEPLTVTQATTTTSVASSANPSVFGQSVTFTATVTGSTNVATLTGTVTFLDGAVTLGTGIVGGGTATFTTSSLGVGAHSITASYSGDANFFGSTSAVLTQTVNKANTTTTVVSSLNPSTFGQSVTFTATVTVVSPGAGSPSGTVTFLDGVTTIGTGTLSGGTATFTTSTLAQGSHSITAQYGGDASFNGSTSPALTQTVNPPTKTNTTTTVTSSVNPSCFGQTVTFTATVTPVSGTGTPTGMVTFLDGATTIGTATLSGGTASFTISTLAVGSHSITASYGGDTNFNTSTSAVLTQTVNKCGTTVTVASSANPSVFGQSVTFTATVAIVAPGSGTPTGTVNFLDGATVIGSGTLSASAPFTATFTTSALSVGSHSIAASYSGDANFNTSTSAALTQNVTDFTITASTTSVKVNAGDTATITITVGPVNGFTGTVTLTTNPSAGLTATISPGSISGGSGTATLTVSSSTAANYMVTVTGVTGPDSHTTSTINVQVVDFQISASPTSASTTPGLSANSTITIASLNGLTGTVALSTSVSPTTGLTCSLSPTSIPGGSGTSTLTCAGTSGTYLVTVTGTTPSITGTAMVLSHSTTVTVNVMDFSITASPTSFSIAQGTCGTSTITITAFGGFTGTVTLTPIAPPAVTATVTPSTISTSGSASLKVCAATTTPASPPTYPVNVTATSGSLSHSALVTVTVTQATAVQAPFFTQLTWNHRFSLSKYNGVQTFKYGFKSNSTTTIYAAVVITGVDGVGVNGFTLTSQVFTLQPNKNISNQNLSQTFDSSQLGDTFQFTAVIHWGTTATSDPSQLPFTSTLTNGAPTSGSFTVLA